MDDRAQWRTALAQCATLLDLAAAHTAQVIENGFGAQVGLLRGRQIGPGERDPGAVGVQCDNAPVRALLLQLVRRAGALPGFGRGGDIALAVDGVGDQVTAPELALVLAAKKQLGARLEVEVGHLVLRHITNR